MRRMDLTRGESATMSAFLPEGPVCRTIPIEREVILKMMRLGCDRVAWSRQEIIYQFLLPDGTEQGIYCRVFGKVLQVWHRRRRCGDVESVLPLYCALL